MIIVKWFFLMLTLLLIINCKNMDEKNFEVIGNDELLKDIKVNCIFTKYENGNITYETKTLLYDGESIVTPYNESYSFYEFFISYKDNFVESFRMENIFRNASDQVNQLYIEKDDNNEIFYWFVGRKAEVGNNDVYKKILVPKNKFLSQKRISDSVEIEKYNKLFFHKW